MRTIAALLVCLALAAPIHAQEKQKRIDWPSVTAATALQLTDMITTQRFLASGSCVESNSHFQASQNQLTYMWSAKLGLIGSLWAINVIAEAHPNRAMKWISRGLNWEAAALGGYATIHNLRTCF